MVGNIIEPLNIASGGGSFDPDNYFDPTTHIATESNFIKLLEDGYYEESLIGYKVQLSNSTDYNNGTWIIADVNHDSDNTGQTDCYDLISQDCFYSTTFGSNQNWRSSTPRKWLNSTFYRGFSSNLKNRLMNPKYNSDNTWYTDDIVIIPSFIEVNGNVPTDYSSYIVSEGVKYPIFESGSSDRIKYQSGTSTTVRWWTRSRLTNNSNYVCDVKVNGDMGSGAYSNNRYLAPILRVS